jgi:UDPglucose 6-dehydrogenase
MKPGPGSVSVIGMGYVGLCTAAGFASKGLRTVGVDIDDKRVEQIQQGKAPIYEPQLDSMLKTAVRKKLLVATSDISQAANAGSIFLTVGTPSRNDGSIDLTYIERAIEELGRALQGKKSYTLVIVKSTVVPGTTNKTVKPILERSSSKAIGTDLGLCSNPEFLKEGTAINDALHPDKIVIGADDKKSANKLRQLYTAFYGKNLPPIILASPETAELVKYASNAFLATKVSFINAIANIAQRIPRVDVNQVAEAIGRDPRIGPLFLKAGPGYGGSCFHKDLQAIINFSQDLGYSPILLRATEETNEQQAEKVVELSEKLTGPLEQKRVAVLGLAFKKDTDDIREAASLRVIRLLLKKGVRVVAYDPLAIPNAKKLLPGNVEFAADEQSALKGTDCCIVMTEWNQFGKLQAKDYMALMRTPNLVDARRLYNPRDYGALNFAAVGLGPQR